MTKTRIRDLASLIPPDDAYFANALAVSPAMRDLTHRDIVIRDDRALLDPSFGWHLIKALTNSKLKLPPWVDEDFLRRAYVFESSESNSRDYALIESIALLLPKNYYRRAIFEAALITDASFELIGERLGYDTETVRAFEQLFFNVRERRHEHVYIGAITFETGVLTELMPNYLEREHPGVILLRTAVRHGLEAALSLAGLHPGKTLTQDIYDAAARFENRIMANANQHMDWGLANQPSRSISGAKGIMVAAKAGGQQSKTEETIGMSNLGDSIMDELQVSGNVEALKIAASRDRMEKAKPTVTIDLPSGGS